MAPRPAIPRAGAQSRSRPTVALRWTLGNNRGRAWSGDVVAKGTVSPPPGPQSLREGVAVPGPSIVARREGAGMNDFEVDQVVQRALDRLTLLAETTTAMTSTLDSYAAVDRV